MSQFSLVAEYLSSPYWCVYSAQCSEIVIGVCTVQSEIVIGVCIVHSAVRLLLVCVQCTVQSEIVIGVCTVHSEE